MTVPSLQALRRRTRFAGLPRFSMSAKPSELFDPRNAMLDRFDSHVEVPIAFGSEEARNEWLSLIGDQTGAGGYPLISRHTHSGRQARGRSIGMTIAAGWHFAGKIELRTSRKADGSFQGFLVLDLNMNFTRWLADRFADALQPSDDLDTEAIIRKLPSFRCPATLDDADNLLPHRDHAGDPRQDTRLRKALELLTLYVEAVQVVLQQRLVTEPRAHLAENITISDLRLQGANYAEAYHELWTPDALSVVEGIRAGAIRATSNPEFRDFIGERRVIGGGLQGNSPYVSVPLAHGVDMVLYSKTPTTLRWEVRFRGKVLEEARHREQRGQPLPPLADILHSFKGSITGRIQTFFKGLSVHLTDVEAGVDLLDLLSAIQKAAGHDEGRARVLLSLLANGGGVSETSADGVSPPQVIQSLLQAGILRREIYRHGNAARNAPPRYALRTPYASVIGPMMREAHRLPLVAALPN